jgi:hypothetical protein
VKERPVRAAQTTFNSWALALENHFFFGAVVGVGLVAGGGTAGDFVSTAVVASGSLSAFLSIWLICHTCVVPRVSPKPGMPVSRIPFAIFQ